MCSLCTLLQFSVLLLEDGTEERINEYSDFPTKKYEAAVMCDILTWVSLA